MAKTRDTFEGLMEDTEKLVEELEGGELSLDASLRKYEKGVANLRRCAEILERAEEKVRVLVERADGELTLEDAADPKADEPEEDA